MKKRVLRKQIAFILVFAIFMLPLNGIETKAKEKKLEQTYIGDGYEVTFKIESQWTNNYNATVTLKNTGKVKMENWHLAFKFDNRIENIWNAKVDSIEEGNYIIKNLGWNQNIEPGNSIRFGFTAKGDFTEYPESYILLGEVVNADEDEYTVTYRIESQWGVGFNGNVTITNNSEKVIEGWSLGFDFDNEIRNIWNAQIGESKDGRYLINNATYNQNIEPGASISFGFTVASGNVDNKIANVSMQKIVMAKEDSGATIDIDVSSFRYNEAGDFYMADNTVDTLNGTFVSKEKLNSLIYVIKNGSGVVLKEGEIKAENQWKIDDFGLAVGMNTITITAVTNKAKYEKSIIIMNFLLENGNNLDLDMEDNDGDGIPNYFEDYFGTDKNKADTDGDGLSDYDEIFKFKTDPLKVDTDDNGVSDGDEDIDGDGLSNLEELRFGTDPFNPDSDGDGLNDYDEVCVYLSDPLLADSDTDGLPDALEIEYGMDPKNPDTLGDGILDGDRIFTYTLDGDESDNGKIKPLLTIDLQGKQIESLTVDKVSEDDVFLNPDIPGYLGNAFDFHVEGGFSKSTLTFEFDKNLLNDPAFVPAIYYWDEDEQFLVELPDQSVQGNTVSVELEHFSSYMVIAKNIHDEELFKFEVLAPTEQEMQNKKFDVALVLDESGSISSSNYTLMKNLSKDLVNGLRNEDRVAVFTFGTSVRKRSGFVDITTASSIIGGLSQYGGSTAIYNAIHSANTEFIANSSSDATKIMIVLTDGADNASSSANTPDAVSKKAAENNIVIYTIGVGSVNSSILTNIAQTTGGAYYSASNFSQLAVIFDRLEEEVDLYRDSDNDGLSDYHEKKIDAGEIKLGTGATLDNINGLHLNYLNPDSDGDGLKDGEELKIRLQYLAGRSVYYCSMYSNPCLKDSDEDGYEDQEELHPIEKAENFRLFQKVSSYEYTPAFTKVNCDDLYGEGWNDYDVDFLYDTYNKAAIYGVVGSLAFPNASGTLLHFLDNVGTEYEINIPSLLWDSGSGINLFFSNMDLLIDHVKSVLKDGETMVFASQQELITHDYSYNLGVLLDIDWTATLGVSHGAIVAKISRNGNKYNMDFRYIVFDAYDWDPNRDFGFVPGVKDCDLYKLHHAGWARHFPIYSEFNDSCKF